MKRLRSTDRAVLALLLFAVSVLLVSYIGICHFLGTVSPWAHVIHENGRLTLVGTILYFEHVVRELPHDVVLGIAIGGSFAFFVPLRPRARRTRLWRSTALALAVLLVVVVVGSLRDVGLSVTLENLVQRPLRDGVEGPGAHWRYHLVSRLALMLLAFAAVGIFAAADGRSPRPAARPRLFVGALGLFGLLSLVFGVNLDPFTDPQFLGHQARELFTHTLVTLPAATAVLWWVARVQEGNPPQVDHLRIHPYAIVSGAISVTLGAWLAVGFGVTGAAALGQSQSLASSVGAHFFEHTIGYFMVPLVALTAYLWPGRGAGRP